MTENDRSSGNTCPDHKVPSDEGARTIAQIAEMLVKWIRGYLWIIVIEMILYLGAFSLCKVPYAPILAMVAGLGILLPYFGLIVSILLTSTVCLVFCHDHVVRTLIGVFISYLVINGVLEQLFLYPRLVGGALKLSPWETILAVMLGGLVFGIPGMILAVPAAAVMKYLIRKISQAGRKKP